MKPRQPVGLVVLALVLAVFAFGSLLGIAILKKDWVLGIIWIVAVVTMAVALYPAKEAFLRALRDVRNEDQG